MEQAVIQVVPSLTLLAELGRRPMGNQLLFAGCSSFRGQVAPLPHVPAELAALSALWSGPVEQLLNEACTPEALLAACTAAGKQLAVLHLASHGQHLPSKGSAAHLKFTTDNLLLPEIMSLGLQGTNVVLSTCEGASADVLPGEEVLSLGRAFLAAGASAVLASLWPLPDHVLPTLMTALYQHLARDVDLALALALAQRELLVIADNQESSAPHIWGALLVTGMPGPVVGHRQASSTPTTSHPPDRRR
jgi:CHAT domain-containing protein